LKDGLPIEKAKRPPHLKEYLERKGKKNLSFFPLLEKDKSQKTG